MSSTIAHTYTLFPSTSASSYTPSSPSAFSVFSLPQHHSSPRDAHFMYEDLRTVLRPSNGQRARKESGSSLKMGFKKMFGGM
ncbi:hypothetical protein BXZ70DRAFT_917364 [Cristinia sonorae]|uniref:Uncharacterized protein n=1 Tax=Cristinia sonorae TaxID=1940300 RepID=A0A8K0UX73_9AGAR|nr:hypothetical protein BXZ70DRAFT_917364 [Cristinia sonorae]